MEAGMTYDTQKSVEERFVYRSQTRSWDCWAWGTIIGLGGGIVAIVVGSALAAISWLLGAGSYAGTAGTILLLAAIPLFIVGAESLDVEEKKKKRAREARCNDDG
jgi:high-affinity Fe2+/Pb2+ permease